MTAWPPLAKWIPSLFFQLLSAVHHTCSSRLFDDSQIQFLQVRNVITAQQQGFGPEVSATAFLSAGETMGGNSEAINRPQWRKQEGHPRRLCRGKYDLAE